MPMYSFEAVSKGGKTIDGVIDADSLYLAKEKIKQRQVLLIKITPFSQKNHRVRLSPTLILNFTRELAQLLKAGLPLYESLVTIEEKYRGHRAHSLFVDLCDHLKLGKSLSSALASYGHIFNEIYLSMVKAAEQGGHLSETFAELALLISKQEKLKKQLVSSLAYPAFLAFFCFIVVGALFFFVIPSMQELFEGRTLHPLTSSVLAISNFLNNYLPVLAAGIGLLLIGICLVIRQKKFRIFCFRWACRAPFLRSILIQSSLVRFCRAMFLLLSGGVPLINALCFARKTMNNVLLEEVILQAEKKLIEGKKLSYLLNSEFIPSLVVRMVAIAEETGNFAITMKNLSEIYEEELEKNLQQLTAFLQPAVLLFLGLVVGVVVLSILLPLTDVSSFLSS
ncbi:MAG: type II secretion system F family protein [Chlamydiae bacterium]|nr:type II secretion system F family protein [Chlamydiota bacterium]